MHIIIAADKQREEHARKMVKLHLDKLEEKFPRIEGAPYAKVPRECDCGNKFWVADNNMVSWECEDCRPKRKGNPMGFSAARLESMFED